MGMHNWKFIARDEKGKPFYIGDYDDFFTGSVEDAEQEAAKKAYEWALLTGASIPQVQCKVFGKVAI